MVVVFTSIAFIKNSIENWFSVQVENSLEKSLEVAQTYYQQSAKNALYYGKRISERITKNKLLNEDRLGLLKELIEKKQKEYNLGAVEVFSAQYEELVRSVNPDVPAKSFIGAESNLVKEGLAGKEISRIESFGSGDIIRGVIPVHSTWKKSDIVGVVVVSYYIPKSLVTKMSEILKSFEDYKYLKILKNPIKTTYFLILSLIGLLVLFLATWIGFYIAKGITIPIQMLAEGTNEIANGNLNFEIEGVSDDEIGTLVSSFNKMTHDLRISKAKIEEANRDLKNTNVELDQRRRYMEIVLRNVKAGVVSIDRYGRITTINRAAEKMLKIKTDKVLGKFYKDVLKKEHVPIVMDLLKHLKESPNGSIEKHIELSIDNNNLTFLVSLTILKDELNGYLGMVLVFDDMTQILKVQRMEAWREVARRIAHEIKNPLTPIKLSAQRLRRRYEFLKDDKIFDECTKIIINQVEEIKNLVNEFSNFARMPAINPTLNDINEIIKEAIALFEGAHRNIKFTFTPDRKIPLFDLDRSQIKRAMINVIDNAVSAIEGDGEVKVKTEFDKPLQIVRIKIADTGCGISSVIKSRLFEPYFSTKKSGTGLGLAIVNNIISDHNGYIRVKDNHPTGTIFIIELPIKAKNTALKSA
jgi:two-component system nitrogen regulation sensor histidine kinase NtrY